MAAKTLKIRRFRSGEAAPVAKLARSVIHAVPYYKPEMRWGEAGQYTAAQVASRARKGQVFLVAREKGRVVGFCHGYDDLGTFWLNWIGVSPTARKSGIAHKLMARLERVARKQGAHKLWFDTIVQNREASRFFRGHGYRRVARLNRHWHGDDYLLWEKFL